MPTCGNCHQTGQSVEHVKACYAQRRSTVITAPVSPLVEAYQESDYRPMALTWVVPASRYALPNEDGDLVFYEVRHGRSEKWKGYEFVDLLIGSPGDWRRVPVKGSVRKAVLKRIALNPKAAALTYSRNFTRCACCNSPLSDPASVALGFGPECAKRFA